MNKRHQQSDPGELLPPGEVRPIAEIEIGPSKHEKFLDQNYKKVVLAVLVVALAVSGVIIYQVLSEEKMRDSGSALVHALHEGMSAEGLNAVGDEYPGTHAAVTAGYLKAMLAWQEGRRDDGNALMEQFVTNAPTDEWKAQAAAVLGCSYMQTGKNEDAKRCFEMVVNSGTALYAPVALLSLGDIARAANEPDKARAYYDEVLNKYPESSFSQQSDLMPGALARRELIGVTSPQKVREASPSQPSGNAEGVLQQALPTAGSGGELTVVRPGFPGLLEPGQKFPVAVRSRDRGIDASHPLPPEFLDDEAADRFDRTAVQGGIAHDASRPDVAGLKFELRLDEHERVPSLLQDGKGGGQNFGQRDKRHIRHDQCNLFPDVLRCHVAGVELFAHDDAGVVSQLPDQLVRADIHRVDPHCAVLEQAVGESAR